MKKITFLVLISLLSLTVRAQDTLSKFSNKSITTAIGVGFVEAIHRGLQYCSNQYQEILKRNKINCSMTESYDPYANAIAERVNGILKAEFIGYKNKESIETMGKLVKNSIDIYNEQRPHYSCFYMTPNQMHLQNRIKIKTYKKQISQ